MALKLTGLAKLDDGSHVAPCSSHINSYTTTSGGQTFVVSGGAMVMIQGPPPMQNQMAMIMGQGGSGWPTFNNGDAVTWKELNATQNYFDSTVQVVMQTGPTSFMLMVQVGTVSNFNSMFVGEFVMSVTIGRIITAVDLTATSPQLDVDEYFTLKNEKYLVSAITQSGGGSQIDFTPLPSTTPNSGDFISRWASHTGDASNKADLLGHHGDTIISIPVIKTDNSVKEVPFLRFDRVVPNEGTPFTPCTIMDWLRIGPDDQYPTTNSKRFLWVGYGNNHVRDNNIPNDRYNIGIGFQIWDSVGFNQARLNNSHGNIILGFNIQHGGQGGLTTANNVIIGENIAAQQKRIYMTKNVILGYDIANGPAMQGQTNQDFDQINNNVFLGYRVAHHIGEHSNGNVVMGYEAGTLMGDQCTSNVIIGNGAGPNHAWSQGGQVANGVENVISIGNEAHSSAWGADNEVTLGDGNITAIRCNQTSISSLSDKRDKTNIEDLPAVAGLEFINALTPKIFNWDRRVWYTDGVDENGAPVFIERDGSKISKDHDYKVPNSGLQMGFIAQDVVEAIDKLTPDSETKCLEDSKIVWDRNPDALEARPQELIVPMVKAIQELSSRLEKLEG